MSTEIQELKIARQTRILLSLVWGFALILVGEGYMLSPVPGLISGHVVAATSALFWLAFWLFPLALYCSQPFVLLPVLNRYFPQLAPRNRRWAIGTPLASFILLMLMLMVVLPVSPVHL